MANKFDKILGKLRESDEGVNGAQGPPGDTGPQGPAGNDGADGEGVPTGGTTGQYLNKVDGTDYNTQWSTLPTIPDELTDLDTTVTGTELNSLKTKLDGIETGADVTDTTNVTAAGAVMDTELTSLSGVKTLTVPDNTTISSFGASLVDDVDASAARTTLDVDQAGTDNSTDVTLAGTPEYITISGQVITRNEIDLTTDTNTKITVGTTAPSTPSTGDLWIDTN